MGYIKNSVRESLQSGTGFFSARARKDRQNKRRVKKNNRRIKKERDKNPNCGSGSKNVPVNVPINSRREGGELGVLDRASMQSGCGVNSKKAKRIRNRIARYNKRKNKKSNKGNNHRPVGGMQLGGFIEPGLEVEY